MEHCRYLEIPQKLLHTLYEMRLELRWLGMDIGFGLFATCTINPAAQSLQLLGVADYEYRGRHTTMQVHCTASDRAAENRTDDFVAVYGPLILLNASWPQHGNLTRHDQDLGMGSKKVHVELMSSRRQSRQ